MIIKPAYKELQTQFNLVKNIKIINLFNEDCNRVDKFSLSYEGLFFDFSKNNINDETLEILIKLANQSDLANQIKAMFNGDKINNTENRAVLHTALRAGNSNIIVDGQNICSKIQNVLIRMKNFTDKLRNGEHRGHTGKVITDIVNIGIGGSDLGPVLATQALKPYKANLAVHFVSSIDGYQILDTLSELNPETTLFIVASKSFTTQETMTNANTARKWFLDHAKLENNIKHHFVAVSTNMKEVSNFGIDTNNMFEFWNCIGGRYSLFSAIGLSIMLYIGYDNFAQMLNGAKSMDKHFLETTDFKYNLPVILGLIGIWHINFCNLTTQIISPYNTRLTRFPAYVQQLEMESNGKSVNKDGERLSYNTCPIIWGDNGINAQHAYYQLLHQGTTIHPMDIIVTLSNKFTQNNHNDILIANAYAQSEAFMCGKTYQQAKTELLNSGMAYADAQFLAKHKIFEGNRPTNTIILEELSPYYFGMLIALYEHKTFTQGVIWNINSFDQMGVELGKQLAQKIVLDIENNNISLHDDSTTNLINKYKNTQ